MDAAGPDPSRATTDEGSRRRGLALLRASPARVAPDAMLSHWAQSLGPPGAEPAPSRTLARVGGVVAVLALLTYLAWRIGFTIPDQGGPDEIAAWALVTFEALALPPLVIRVVTLWNIDSRTPVPAPMLTTDLRVAVFIPTYNEPVEVLAPTVAAAMELAPDHETWVLDDGDRPWVAALCRANGARYVAREQHDHAKAGNMNHALDLIEREARRDGQRDVDVVAVLDCDHVPLPTFLTATLGWFDDPEVALVQAPQSYYNAGAFDDDGSSGEQGVFFHVLLPARNHDGAGPFWCGSTSLIRTSALREIGGIATETIVEDMHTTLGLIRAGWKTVYHHQTVAVGLAPETPAQYLLQRRRWGMGSMQVLARERLWGAKRWLSWRNWYEYLGGTLWWLEGVSTVVAFVIPATILLSGAQTSTATPLAFTTVFVTTLVLRFWGTIQLFRGHMHLRTSFALRIFRVPVGLSCLWWLITRRTLSFDVTPKAGAAERVRGRVPGILTFLLAANVAILAYAAAGMADLVPWQATDGATVASAAWLVMAAFALWLGIARIRNEHYATSRRNAHRVPLRATITLDGREGEVLDVSVGGLGLRFDDTELVPDQQVEIVLPGTEQSVRMTVVRTIPTGDATKVALRVADQDWEAYRTMSLWLFHTPPGAVTGVPAGVPAAAARQRASSDADTVLPAKATAGHPGG